MKRKILEAANEFVRIDLDQMRAYDITNIANGTYTPLEGFLTSVDFESVVNNLHLADGTLWSTPIILDIERTKLPISAGDEVLLWYNNKPLALLEVEDVYKWNKAETIQKLFRTKDPQHPGVGYFSKMGDYLIGGKIWLLTQPSEELSVLTPEEARGLFKRKGWKTIVAFQTRNVPHKGHEFLIRYALQYVDGAFINPVIGKKKKGDWRDEVIEAAWEKLRELYFPKDSTVLGFLRYVMRYAGPREALHHAIMRKNLGVTHFIIGRDHAGVGNYYKPYEAQEFVKQYEDELEIEIMAFKESYWCEKCQTIVNDKICPHKEEFKIRFSGTKIRKMITSNQEPDERKFRKEILEVIKKFENPFY